MSGVERSAHHSGIVTKVVLSVGGVVMACGGGYMFVAFGELTIAGMFVLIGVGLAAVGGYSAYETLRKLREVGKADPVTLVVEDLNEPGRILKGFVGLVLAYVLFFGFSITQFDSVEAAYRGWMDLAAREPLILVVFAAFNVVAIIGILFGRGRGRVHHH